MESISPTIESHSHVDSVNIKRAPGPLFKELYAGLIDVDDPHQWGPVINDQTSSFLANTTDISSFDQFAVIHRVPEKWGTSYHHSSYLKTIDALMG